MSRIIYVKLDHLKEIKKWCKDNLTKNSWKPLRRSLIFTDENDLVLFKLRWQEYIIENLLEETSPGKCWYTCNLNQYHNSWELVKYCVGFKFDFPSEQIVEWCEKNLSKNTWVKISRRECAFYFLYKKDIELFMKVWPNTKRTCKVVEF